MTVTVTQRETRTICFWGEIHLFLILNRGVYSLLVKKHTKIMLFQSPKCEIASQWYCCWLHIYGSRHGIHTGPSWRDDAELVGPMVKNWPMMALVISTWRMLALVISAWRMVVLVISARWMVAVTSFGLVITVAPRLVAFFAVTFRSSRVVSLRAFWVRHVSDEKKGCELFLWLGLLKDVELPMATNDCGWFSWRWHATIHDK